MPTTIDEIMNDINLRWVSTDRMTWADSRAIRQILEKHLNNLDTGNKDWIEKATMYIVQQYILEWDETNERYDNIVKWVKKTILENLPKLDTGKVDEKINEMINQRWIDSADTSREVMIDDIKSIISLKSQIPEDEKDKLIEQIECMQVELDWYKNKPQLPEKLAEPSEQVEEEDEEQRQEEAKYQKEQFIMDIVDTYMQTDWWDMEGDLTKLLNEKIKIEWRLD